MRRTERVGSQTDTGMPARLSYFTFFVRDWLGSPKLEWLSTEQQGALLRLILHAWEAPGCVLPVDRHRLARMAAISGSEAEWDRVLQPVIESCFLVEGGGYVPVEPFNLRAIAEKAEAQVEAKRRGGEKSVLRRQAKFGTAQPPRPEDAEMSEKPKEQNAEVRKPGADPPSKAERELEPKPDPDPVSSKNLEQVFGGQGVERLLPRALPGEPICDLCGRVCGDDSTAHEGRRICRDCPVLSRPNR